MAAAEPRGEACVLGHRFMRFTLRVATLSQVVLTEFVCPLVFRFP